MEVPLDFGQNKISLNDIVAMELIFGYLNVHKLNVLWLTWTKYVLQNLNWAQNNSVISNELILNDLE